MVNRNTANAADILVGRRFGKLVVKAVKYFRKTGTSRAYTYAICICDCGKEVEVLPGNLRHGFTTSCGCNKHRKANEKPRPRQTLADDEMAGRRFGSLVVQKKTNNRAANGVVVWQCKCDCGNIVLTRKHRLIAGHTASCGCLQAKRASEAATKWWQDNAEWQKVV